jgi:thiol-disulfide isomerase/thioredoxin
MYKEKYFEKPVYYLQRSDFDDNGNLVVPELRDKKVVVMIQANYCGHCTNAKADYFKAAKYFKDLEQNGGTSYKGRVVFATIQADGNQRGEKELNDLLGHIKPGFVGFPDYVLYVNGKRLEDNGPPGRNYHNIINYVMGSQ